MTRGYLTEIREFPSSFGMNVMLVERSSETKPNELIVCSHPIVLCNQVTFCKVDINDPLYNATIRKVDNEHARKISLAFHTDLELLFVWVEEKLSECILDKEVIRLLVDGLRSIVTEAESKLPNQN